MISSPASRDARVEHLSREIALVVSDSGEVTWTDGRSERLFGSITGSALRSLAPSGTAEQVDALVAAAKAGRIERFEVCLVSGRAPRTFAFRGEPAEGGGALLVGQRLTDDETDTLTKITETLAEVSELHREAARHRRELSDANRALVVMHNELDDKNDELQRSSEIKSRVVSSVSHEFRTPINSILGITQLLLQRLDGDLTSEQEKQLRFVRSSAESLSDLINDLLDLSRIEAGRHELRVSEFDPALLLSSLRGMMNAVPRAAEVELVVEDEVRLPRMKTDEAKVAQILRNLVSNALKFTERGSVRVTATSVEPSAIRFVVEDTGIGIAPENVERIFEEFAQIDGDVQRRVRGTGLGLSLSRKLADLLGGSLTVRSELGKGSTFTLEIPLVHAEISAVDEIVQKSATIDASKLQVLVVEDNRKTLFVYEKYLSNAGFQVVPARTVEEARQALARVKPAAIVLDIILEGETTWGFLHELKEAPETRDIPVMVTTVIDRAQKARALGADEFWLKPIDGDRLIRKLAELAKRSGPVKRVLVIDDDEAARYLVRRLIAGAPYTVLEAATAADGVEVARAKLPDVILLDFVLGADTAFDVIDDLKADADTRGIPIILTTAKSLDDVERARLERETAAIVKKQSLTREVAITRIREVLEAHGIAERVRSS